MPASSKIVAAKNFLRSGFFQNTILAFTFCLAILSMILTLRQNSQLQDMQYSIKATELKPILAVTKPPEIVSIMPRFDTISDTEALGIYFNSFKTKLELKNTSSNTATIVAKAWTGAYAGDELLRQVLLGVENNYEFDSFLDEDFFKSRQIQPEDIADFEFVGEVSNVKNDKFVRHYIIIYKNEAGMLYDIYCWAHFAVRTTPCSVAKDNKANEFQISLYKENRSSCIKVAIDVIETNAMTYVYNNKESIILNDTLKKYKNNSGQVFEVWRRFKNTPNILAEDNDK